MRALLALLAVPLASACSSDSSSNGAAPQAAGNSKGFVDLAYDTGTYSSTNALVALLVRESNQGGVDLNGDGDTEDRVIHVHDLGREQTFNLGLAAWSLETSGRSAVFTVFEDAQGVDLNGDGDRVDWFVHVAHLADATGMPGTGDPTVERIEVQATGIPRANREAARFFGTPLFVDGPDLVFVGDPEGPGAPSFHHYDLETRVTRDLDTLGTAGQVFVGDGVLAYLRSEYRMDLNGDGDTLDDVAHVLDVRTGESTNLGVALNLTPFFASAQLEGRDGLVFVAVDERSQGTTDLNGDGDADDLVAHVYDFETGRLVNTEEATTISVQCAIGDGYVAFPSEESEILIYDAVTEGVIPTGILGCASVIASGLAVLNQSEGYLGMDLNGDGDMQDWLTGVWDLRTATWYDLGFSYVLHARYFDDGSLVFTLSEEKDVVDWNEDGDEEDFLIYRFDARKKTLEPVGGDASEGVAMGVLDGELAVIQQTESDQDLNGDGDSLDRVVAIIDPRTGRQIGSGISGNVAYGSNLGFGDNRLGRFEEAVTLLVSETFEGPVDLNGDGDTDDQILRVITR